MPAALLIAQIIVFVPLRNMKDLYFRMNFEHIFILTTTTIMSKLFTTRLFVLSFSAFLMVFTTSCATIFTGVNQKVYIDSNPPGATIIVDGENKGTTPQVVTLRRELSAFEYNYKEIKLIKEGYKENYRLYANFNPVCALNIFNVGIFAIVDAATGSICRYKKSTVFELGKNSPTEQTEENIDVDEAVEKLKKLKYLYEEGVITEEEYKKEKEKLLK